jgi:excisionase family DNA binding protein
MRTNARGNANAEELPRLLVGVLEAARLLSVSPRTIYELLDSGELPSVKVRKRRLFRVVDLRRFADRRASA